MKKNPSIFIFPLALVSLVLGMLAGWQRIHWEIPLGNLAGDHGALMTGSFVGTLICLERSVIHRNKWWRLLPVVNGLSIVFFILKLPLIAYFFLLAGSAGLFVLMLSFLVRMKDLSHAVLVMGAAAWLIGNLILLNQHAYNLAVKWWMFFLLWTIFGERLELSRMLPVSFQKTVSLYLIMTLSLVGMLVPGYSNAFFACSLLALAAWLFLFDMSRYAIRKGGQHRYSAVLLMTGYGWLIITALWMLFWSQALFVYDAILHGFFLGFVISMIFAHMPIIFPGIIKINISLYHPGQFIVFSIFQASLVTRVMGDALLNIEMRKWGAMINGISILVFFVATAALVLSGLIRIKRRYVVIGR